MSLEGPCHQLKACLVKLPKVMSMQWVTIPVISQISILFRFQANIHTFIFHQPSEQSPKPHILDIDLLLLELNLSVKIKMKSESLSINQLQEVLWSESAMKTSLKLKNIPIAMELAVAPILSVKMGTTLQQQSVSIISLLSWTAKKSWDGTSKQGTVWL